MIVSLIGSAAFVAFTVSGCNDTLQRPHFAAPPQEAEVIAAQEQRASHVEVTVTAPVKRVLSDDTEGTPHERFLLILANGTTVLVAHNTSEAGRVPLSEGSVVTVHGEYIWNNRGGVIHWTHHSDNGRHEGGFIDFQGQHYQ